jgi:uncharacterized metal-binding protein
MEMNCAKCKIGDKICRKPDGLGHEFCPSQTKRDIIEKSLGEYDGPLLHEFARQASIQEGECYANRNLKPYVMQPVKTRVAETVEFAKKWDTKDWGWLFALGLPRRREC